MTVQAMLAFTLTPFAKAEQRVRFEEVISLARWKQSEVDRKWTQTFPERVKAAELPRLIHIDLLEAARAAGVNDVAYQFQIDHCSPVTETLRL